MKHFNSKLLLVLAIVLLTTSLSTLSPVAYGNSFLDTYSAVPNNYAGDEGYDEAYWFDCEEFTQVTHRSIFRGEPYVIYLRDYSMLKHLSKEDRDGPFWGVDSKTDNRYLIFNPDTYWTQDNCIEDAYTFTIDVALGKSQTKLEDDSFDGIEIPNVATKFAGIRMYTVGSDQTDAMNTTASLFTPGTSGLGFNFNVANNSKDELIIYALNKDKSVAQASFNFSNGKFNDWTTFKVTDQLDGNLNVYIDGKLTAKITINGSNVAILDASGVKKASTSNANIYDLANFHVVNCNDGDLNIDNVGVKYYEDSDDVIPTPPPTPTPIVTSTPRPTIKPATSTPRPTIKPATSTPRPTIKPATSTPRPTIKPASATPIITATPIISTTTPDIISSEPTATHIQPTPTPLPTPTDDTILSHSIEPTNQSNHHENGGNLIQPTFDSHIEENENFPISKILIIGIVIIIAIAIISIVIIEHKNKSNKY